MSKTSPCSSQPGSSPTSKSSSQASLTSRSSSQASQTSKPSSQASPTSKSSPQPSTAKKNPFRNIVCVTTDETGRTRTDVLQAPVSSVSSIKTDKPKNNENTKPICSAEAFKLHLGKTFTQQIYNSFGNSVIQMLIAHTLGKIRLRSKLSLGLIYDLSLRIQAASYFPHS